MQPLPPPPDPAAPGTTRRNPDTGDVAVRMDLPAPREWLVVFLGDGGRYVDPAMVADWPADP